MRQLSKLGQVGHRFLHCMTVGTLLAACIAAPAELLSQADRNDEVAAIVHRAEELNSQGKYKEAIVESQKALDIDAHSSYAVFRMAEAQFKLGNHNAALNSLREVLQGDLRPKWTAVWSYVNLGKIYDIRGQRYRALPYYHKAVDTADDSFSVQAEAKKCLNEPCLEHNIAWPPS
jgi:tetratricopeptide (TPR) repeat protein